MSNKPKHISLNRRNRPDRGKSGLIAELLQNLPKLPWISLLSLVQAYNCTIPCEICSKPVGSVGDKNCKKYCKNCSESNVPNFTSKKHYWVKGRKNMIIVGYKPLIEKLPKNVADEREIISAILNIIRFRTTRKRGREQVLGCALIYLSRKHSLGYSGEMVEKWTGADPTPLWTKILMGRIGISLPHKAMRTIQSSGIKVI